jgi:hypothetical protein
MGRDLNQKIPEYEAGSKQFCLFHAGFLHDLFFDTEDGGDNFFRNVG